MFSELAARGLDGLRLVHGDGTPPVPVAHRAALAPGISSLFAVPFVSGTGFSTLAGDLTLLASVHRCESAVLFGHLGPPSKRLA